VKKSNHTVAALDPELIPKDDGYALAIFYGAEVLGSMKDCGCPSHPEGGMIWRMGYSHAFTNAVKGVPTLQVDAGYFFSDVATPAGELYPFTLKQNEWLLKGYNQMDFTAANLSYHDLPYAERLFEKSVYAQQEKTTPFLKRIISANVRATNPAYVSPPAYLIHEVAGERMPDGRKLRVAFIGLTGTGETRTQVTAFKIQDPLAAARRVVPKARAESDVVVVLAYLAHDQAKQLAQQVPGIDLIIQANGYHGDLQPEVVGKTTIAYARYQTRSLGQALVYLNEKGSLTKIQSQLVRLDEAVPKDPEAEKLVAKADAEVTALQQEWAQKHQSKSKGADLLTPVPW
jgi:2',3'-cyclic-nucleotide 2'-phosphodiesterase (5'-nucleotidase family)